jgi:GDP-mannose 4,6-dehydratase
MIKNVLITGITGMVGSHLAEFLFKETDWNIVGISRWRSNLDNLETLIPHINERLRVSIEYADITDYQSLISIFSKYKFDYVFHLAAQSFPLTSFSSPNDTLNTNIQGTVNVLEAVKNYCSDAKVHICSSSEVFGKVPRELIPIDETCNFHPASPYAISKVGVDLLSRYYAEAFNICSISTRMFTHTGPRRGDVFAESSFAKQIALIEAGYIKPIISVGNLQSMRTIADVRDAVRAYYLLLTVNPISGEYYNIGGRFSCTVKDILTKLIEISNVKDYEIIVDKERLRPIDADLQIPNISKFSQHTNWEPIYTFEETMSDLLEYWRKKIHKNGNIYLKR